MSGARLTARERRNGLRAGRAFLSTTVLLLVLAASQTASADDAQNSAPLRWDPAWTHAGPWDYALTGVGLTGLGLETVLLQPRDPPLHWTGPILFDAAARSFFRGSTPEIQANAATASWVFWTIEMGYPFAVDVPYAWRRYGRRVAWDLLWQDATALSLSAAVDLAIRDSVGRARPFVSDCLAQGGSNCLDTAEATRSFPGGHMTETTTATALICTQHLSLHLYGAPWDAVTCGAAVASDVTVGVLRLVTDNHYASDILAGAGLGVLFGWGVPVLMHLHGHDAAGSPGGSATLVVPVPIILNGGGGLGVAGVL